MVVKFESEITWAWWKAEITHSASLHTEFLCGTYVFGQMFLPVSLKSNDTGQTSFPLWSLLDEHTWLNILLCSCLNTLQFYNNLYVYSFGVNTYYPNVIMLYSVPSIFARIITCSATFITARKALFHYNQMTSGLFLDWWHADGH